MIGYLWRGFLVGLLVFLAFIPLGLVGALIAPDSVVDGNATFNLDAPFPESPEDFSIQSVIANFLIYSVLYALYLRLALVLPAHAIGRPLSIGQVWGATTGDFLRLYLPLGALLSVVNTVFTFVAGMVSFGGVFDLMALGITTLIGIGVLTRLYMARFAADKVPA